MKHQENPCEILLKAKDLVAQMTLEEKASLCTGLNFWLTAPVERLGIPAFMLTDGPHGLRKQAKEADQLGLNSSVPATCFPTAVTTACSFDTALLEEIGNALGDECRAESVSILLGPGANIKRSPLCGRNFEYFSEDPLLTGKSAAALISGVQSRNVGTSMKHYLANNQETARMGSNSVIDERALREIYLRGFEIAVKEAQPWTIMCSYNKINDIYASAHERMMTDVLRGDWGFKGLVVTDWAAMFDRVAGIKAGVDLDMPGNDGASKQKIVKAVCDGNLDESLVNLCAARVAAIALQTKNNKTATYEIKTHNELARRAARESAVLLKNDGTLPLKGKKKIAVVGSFAKTPRYQGAGSSKINPHQITSLCDALDERKLSYCYAKGFETNSKSTDPALLNKALKAAKDADVVIACVGLPDSFESEGFDRTHLDMPAAQNELMNALIQTGTPVVAVVSTGSAIVMPWRDKVSSILMMHLAGQNIGNATADLLLGDANPCGKLAESWPLALKDTPCFNHYGKRGNVEYRESVYVGYRYYDKAEKAVAYSFGYGLSYTSFTYSALTLSTPKINAGETLSVSVTVTNTGDRAGKEIVQLYVAPPDGAAFRPLRELRDFTKVSLEPGESKTVEFTLDGRAFAYYNVNCNDWFVESGSYNIEIGASSRDVPLRVAVEIQGSQDGEAANYKKTASAYYRLNSDNWDVPKEQFEQLLGRPVPLEISIRPFTPASTLRDVRTCFLGKIVYSQVKKAMSVFTNEGNEEANAVLESTVSDIALQQLSIMSSGQLSEKLMYALLDMMNGHYLKGLRLLLKK